MCGAAGSRGRSGLAPRAPAGRKDGDRSCAVRCALKASGYALLPPTLPSLNEATAPHGFKRAKGTVAAGPVHPPAAGRAPCPSPPRRDRQGASCPEVVFFLFFFFWRKRKKCQTTTKGKEKATCEHPPAPVRLRSSYSSPERMKRNTLAEPRTPRALVPRAHRARPRVPQSKMNSSMASMYKHNVKERRLGPARSGDPRPRPSGSLPETRFSLRRLPCPCPALQGQACPRPPRLQQKKPRPLPESTSLRPEGS